MSEESAVARLQDRVAQHAAAIQAIDEALRKLGDKVDRLQAEIHELKIDFRETAALSQGKMDGVVTGMDRVAQRVAEVEAIVAKTAEQTPGEPSVKISTLTEAGKIAVIVLSILGVLFGYDAMVPDRTAELERIVRILAAEHEDVALPMPDNTVP